VFTEETYEQGCFFDEDDARIRVFMDYLIRQFNRKPEVWNELQGLTLKQVRKHDGLLIFNLDYGKILYHVICMILNELELIAVGGYGRKEMHPYSDIDLLVLLNEEPNIELQTFLEKFLTLLWDLQLKIGHSVRPIDDCLKRASVDHRIYTTLLETRFIIGCNKLAEKLNTALTENTLWSDQEFIKA